MNRLRGGTSRFTGGPRRTTWENASFRGRVAGFALASVVVAALIVRIDSNIWHAQQHLKDRFAAFNAEQFSFGLSFRVKLRKLSDTLLDYYLSGNSAELENYRQEANELTSWLQTRKSTFVAPSERDAFVRLEAAYRQFLERVDPVKHRNDLRLGDRGHFAAAYERLRSAYKLVLDACAEVAESEHGAFNQLFWKSDRDVLWLQGRFQFSLLLLAALAVALALLVYRGIIAPLRVRLTESQALAARHEKLAALGALGAGLAHEIETL